MDTATLRWILIIAGLALLAGLFLFGNPNRKKPPKRRATRSRRKSRGGNRRKSRDESDRREPTLGTPAETAEHEEGEGEGAQGELGIGAAGEAAGDGGEEREPETLPGPPPEKVMALYLQARDNRRIAGAELLEVALRSGMEFGPMDIFHRRQPGDERRCSAWPISPSRGISTGRAGTPWKPRA